MRTLEGREAGKQDAAGHAHAMLLPVEDAHHIQKFVQRLYATQCRLCRTAAQVLDLVLLWAVCSSLQMRIEKFPARKVASDRRTETLTWSITQPTEWCFVVQLSRLAFTWNGVLTERW